MYEFKGTKGDWKVAPVNTNGSEGFEIHWTEDGECVTDHVYTIEDANLIANAPKLLDALIKLLDVYDKNGQLLNNDVNIAREAVKNALK